ncbi:MAG: carboxypeptidase regulatory-like domain-containing protein [Candidatus Eisenbacteria bacterium]
MTETTLLAEARSRRAISAPFLTALLALIATLVGCSDAEKDLFLSPPSNDDGVIETGDGSIQGVLTFDGVAGGTEATVYALRAYDGSCATQFSYIHLTGTLTDPQWSTELWATTPGMRSLGGCVWAEKVPLPAGQIEWKFVTNRSYDNPMDYVGSGQVQELTGTTTPGAGGSANLIVEIPTAQDYYVFLSESSTPAQYFILDPATAPVASVNSTDGSFEVANLGPGVYELVVVAEGYLDYHVSEVTVAEDAVDLGTQNVSSAAGEVRGTVAFADSPDPRPTATVTLLTSNGVTADEVTTDATGGYVFTGIADGTYDVTAEAPGYLPGTIEDVEFTNGDFVTLDPITLQPGCESAHEIVEVLGDFNNWTPVGQMSQVESCIWEDTLTVVLTEPAPQKLFMKFRTGGAWGVSPDFANCGTEADTLELSGDLCTGDGNAPALGISFPATGDYAFRVNESLLTYEITLLGEVEVGGISGSVTFEGNPSPMPAATIEVIKQTNGEVVRSGSSSTTDGSFDVSSIPVGIYDVTISAFGFVDETIEDVVVSSEEPTLLGTVQLAVSEECDPISDIVQIVGDFNDWNTSTAPMTQLDTCLFADTVQVVVEGAGQTHFMKFRTGNTWDNPPDFGTCTSEADTLFGGGCVNPAAGGPALRVWFPQTGDYEFVLNQENRTFTVTLVTVVDLGSVSGTVAFSDGPDPLLQADVELQTSQGAVVASTKSSATDGSFLFSNLNAGTYSVVASRIGYEGTSVSGVVVAEGDDVAVGTLTLQLLAECQPLHEIVEVMRNGVSEGEMTQIEPCVFVDTMTVAAPGILRLRFRTGGATDNTPDYGPCVENGPTLGLEGDVCPVTNQSELSIQFPNAGDYEVKLDEFNQRYIISPLEVILPGSLEGTVAWDDAPPTPPSTTVKVFVANTNRLEGQTSVAAGAYAVSELEPGFYDVEVSAPGYFTQKVEDIEVLENAATTVPLITLAAISECTPSDNVEIVGNWDGNPGEGLAPHMTNLGGCVWGDTLSIAASALPEQKLKFSFRLNETNFTGQRGRCPGDGTLTLESGGTVSASFCSWAFTNSIEVVVPGDGNYEFTFDEQEETFSVKHLP